MGQERLGAMEDHNRGKESLISGVSVTCYGIGKFRDIFAAAVVLHCNVTAESYIFEQRTCSPNLNISTNRMPALIRSMSCQSDTELCVFRTNCMSVLMK